MYKKIIFDNGLRLITIPNKSTKAVTCLVLVGTGSKYETKEINGISHFLEHMFGKGTKKRPTALEISETIDGIGGKWNFFISKEYTGFWAKVEESRLNLALDWVSDILLNLKLEPQEIKREKGVIIEEINMYLDTPRRYIWDLWEELLYGEQPAGWHTLGKKENILRFQRKHFLDYLKNHYSALNSIVCIAGGLNQEGILGSVKRYFKNIERKPPQQKTEVVENQVKPQLLLHFKKTDQAHLCLGVRAYSLIHPQRYAQEILATILGGNMSSRIFISVREKKGLTYDILTFSELYTDSGYVVTKAGVPNKNVSEVIELILKEYKRIKQKKISQKELKKAKEYLKGNLTLDLESSDEQASFYASQELLTGKILTPEEISAKIDEVTANDIQKVAQDIFKPEKLNLAIIGPFKDGSKFEKMLRL